MDASNNVGISTSDQGQKEAFLNELSQFLSYKGRSLCRTPNLAGRTIDLHDLYNSVTSAGGYHKVTKKGYWEDFLDAYGYAAVSSTLAYGLQKIYQLYLEEYEKVHYFGDDEPQPFSRSYHGGYRRYRYAISDMQRLQASLNMLKPAVSNYDRVVLSLESCLPNEIDFSVNACTLLSGESRHVLRLPQCRRIIDALLMHAGVVSEGHDSYREVLEELQTKTKHNYRNFWRNSIAKKSVLPILLPSKNSSANPDPKSKSESEKLVGRQELCVHQNEPNFANVLQKRLRDVQEKDQNENLVGLNELPVKQSKWSELFHGHRSLGVEDYEGQRVLQIALVLLNLSFEDFNVTLLARHPSLVRFVFLCIHSEYSCLRQTGLDILSNISSHMQLFHLQFDLMTMVFDTINSTILSHDKFERIRGFEVLGNICRTRPNVDHICVSVADDAYDAAVENLMVNDVEVLLAAVEALYRLSKLGEATCTKILFVKGCIDILVCLLTVNVRTFGPDKLAEIRIARKIVPEQQQQCVPQHHQPSSYHTSSLQQTQNLHQQNAALVQRQIHLQQQAKMGSVHQAQPTFATAAPSVPAKVPTTATPQSRPPLPPPQQQTASPPVQIQPNVEPTPASAPPLVSTNSPSQVVSNQPQKQLPGLPTTSSSTPATSAPTASSLPPGVEPTYTHPEAGTIPPVFHYMPAPPGEIVQDNSPESFTQLWIWATYESRPESFIPRVDVYCEYLASSNRYGRHGKTEILSATDFGKCLKQIFPQAASRLFNQGRGQPQYHIAGIKKRATPLPVPGYQLKDKTSVFSSELEYEKIPGTKPATVSTKTHTVTTQVPRPTVPSQSVSQPASSVPIQQLQFQPVLIVSTVPGTNNMTLVPGAQLTTTISQALSPGMIDQAAAAIQSVIVPSQAPGSVTVSAALTNAAVAAGTEILVPGRQTLSLSSTAQATQMVAPGTTHATPENELLPKISREKQTSPGQIEPFGESVARAIEGDTLSKENAMTYSQTTLGDDTTHTVPVNPNCTLADKEKVAESESQGNENLADGSTERQNSLENGLVKEDNHVPVMNGYVDSESALTRDVPGESVPNIGKMDTDEPITEDASKSKMKRTKSKDCEPIVNGFEGRSVHEAEMLAAETKVAPVNGINSFVDTVSENKDGMNGETEAAVNSILDPSDSDDIFKMDVTGVGLSCSTQNETPRKAEIKSSMPCTPISDSVSGAVDSATVTAVPVSTHGMIPNATLPTTSCGASTDVVVTATCQGTSATPRKESYTILPFSATVPTNLTMTPASQTAAPVTPTNPIPHSALNQRLKDTITRRKNFQLTPTLTPANHLPPSVVQQYSYKQPSQDGLAQQIIPITPQQLQHQYNAQRQTEATANQLNQPYQATQQAGVKRQLPQPIVASGPAAKVPRPSHTQFTPAPTYPPQYNHHSSTVRQPNVHRPPPHPQMQPQQHMLPRPQTPMAPHPPGGQPKPKPPIDLMAPNASLLVLYRNVGKVPFANHMDEKEDAISKSVRLTSSLILTNIARYSDLGRSLLQKHEDHLANVAMSQMDCSPIAARLLSELDI